MPVDGIFQVAQRETLMSQIYRNGRGGDVKG